MGSVERRISLSKSVYPKVKAWAERDGLTVAEVTNAILLQTICPYGRPPSQAIASTPPVTMQQNFPDPYQTAATVSDWG